MNRIIRLLLSSAGLMMAVAASAMPPYPGLIRTTQPDGTPVELSLRGDENFSWAVSPDGYTLMRDADGYWTVAETASAADPTPRPSALRYAGSSAATLNPTAAPGLAFPDGAVSRLRRRNAPSTRKTQIDNSFPTKGKHNLLMLLVNFADTRPTYTSAQFNDFMNKENYGGIGSFRDYYLENSYGALDVTTTVTRWVTLPNNKNYYNIDNVPEMIRYALQQLQNEIDLKKFDNDGDGVIDGIALIHQGTGQEASGLGNDIWSHSSVVYGIEVGGVQVGRYTCEPEILATTGGMATIGVMVHEFGHNLGAPDFYDTDYASSGGEFPGTGVWDLMGSGAWNGQHGERPAGVNMWQKIQYGWVDPVLLRTDTKVTSMPGSTFKPVAYRFDTTVPGEYFIVENRRREGQFDLALPGEGVLIYHADEELISQTIDPNTLNAHYPQAMYTVSSTAGSLPSASPSSYGSMFDAPFPGKAGSADFTDHTLPSTRTNSGRYAYCGLHDIRINADGTAAFDFMTDDAPAAPTGLTATASRGNVTLGWSMPDGAKWRTFNIYRNGEKIAQTTEREYVDRAPAGSHLTYYVDAETPEGLVSPYVTADIRLPLNRVASVDATADGNRVTLNWTLENRLTRMEGDLSDERFSLVEHTVRSADFVHRFTADDLTAYAGCRVRRIGFCPYLGPQEASYTIRVWEADADGSNPTIVSERQVKEFGARIWNNILLTRQVEIQPGRELWIGIHMTTVKGNVQMLGDYFTPLDGYGNLMRLGDDGEWETDLWIQGNYYLYAELTDSRQSEMLPVSDLKGDLDPDADLVFPMGFAVYRDGSRLGTSASRCFIDSNVPLGDHTYSVASLYKGNNESSGAEAGVSVTSTAISAPESDTAPLRLTAAAGVLTVEGAVGHLTVTDISGRLVFSVADPAPVVSVGLPAGIYIVADSRQSVKAAIR